jgi:hypothetical protein
MRQVTEDDGTVSMVLADMDEWDSFVANNQDAILERYDSVNDALRHACDGGLALGGGAAPSFVVVFEA